LPTKKKGLKNKNSGFDTFNYIKYLIYFSFRNIQHLNMELLRTFKTSIQQIPAPIKIFLKRALAIFIIWEIIYLFILMPNRIIDRPLSMFTGNATAGFFGWIKGTDQAYCKGITTTEYVEGFTLSYEKATIFLGPKRLIGIADGCNGLSLFVLFVGFIIAYPGKIYFKAIYSIIGIILIVLLNISRCTALALVHNTYPHLTEFAHHYLFNIITYAVVFYLWVQFVKINQKLTTTHA